MNVYSYDGPVMEFQNCVANKWKATTNAVSEKKARSNLAYQYKIQNKRTPNARVSLPGKVIFEGSLEHGKL